MLPAAAVTAVLSVAYLPMFTGMVMFFRDMAHWNYPARWFFRASLLRGEFPSWNPDQGLGFSTLANPLYGLFYPPNWLFLLVSEARVVQMLTWQSFGHVLWGSLGMLLLARRFGASATGGIVAGIAWGLSGHTTAMWTAGLLVLAGAWVPWIAVGFIALARSLGDARADRDRVPLAIAKAAAPPAMAILLGEVFIAIIGLGFAAAMTVVYVLAERRRDPQFARPNLRWAIPAVAAVALAAMVGAAVVLPARAIAATTDRSVPLSREVAETWSFHPLRLIEFVAPGSMGYAYEEYPAGRIVGEPQFNDLPLSYSAYLGASVVALAWLALGRTRRVVWHLAGLLVLALLICAGKHTPVHHWLRTLVPPLAYMRYPEKYLVLVVALISLLAGLGVTRVLDEKKSLWRRTLGFAVLLGLMALTAGLVFPKSVAPYISQGGLLGALGVLIVLMAQLLAGSRPGAAAALITLTVAVDLAAAAWPLQGFGSPELAIDPPPAAMAVMKDFGVRVQRPRVYRAGKVEQTTAKWVQAHSNHSGEWRSSRTLVENTAAAFGLAGVPGYDAAIPSALSILWAHGADVGQAVLHLLGIRYAVLPVDDPRAKDTRGGMEVMMDPLPGARLYRVPGVLPRVYLAGRAEVVREDEVLRSRRIFAPEVWSGGLVFLEPDGIARPLDAPAGPAGACKVERFFNARVQARCKADRSAVAVFLEQYDIGWQAEVNGRSVPIFRANTLMRGVAVEPGEHIIVLTYHPPRLVTGAVISIGATSMLFGLALFGARRRRDPPEKPILVPLTPLV